MSWNNHLHGEVDKIIPKGSVKINKKRKVKMLTAISILGHVLMEHLAEGKAEVCKK